MRPRTHAEAGFGDIDWGRTMAPRGRGQRPDKMGDGTGQVDVHIGNRLREARLLAGLSQAKLAERIGVSFQAVQKYEKGHIRMSASRLWLCARVFGLEPNYFFEGLDGTRAVPASPQHAPEFRRQMLDLFKVYESLPTDVIRLNFLRTMRICARGP
jgi:transcriptional regulator with XRE-family HTH domain